MLRALRAAVLVAIVVFGAAACAGNDEPISLREFNEMFPEQYCSRVEACGAPSGWEYERCLGLLTPSDTELERLIDQGILVYSPEAASRCLDAVAVQQCPIEPSIGPNDSGVLSQNLGIDDCAGVFTYQNPN